MEIQNKKLKFYDNWFKVLTITFITTLILSTIYGLFLYTAKIGTQLFESIGDKGFLFIYYTAGISMFILLISSIVFTWGMIYHMFKGKDWVWLVLTIIFIFVLSGVGLLVPIIPVIFYFFKMRKRFKDGEIN